MAEFLRSTFIVFTSFGFLIAAASATQAAGALAVGVCGAYGYAVDYSKAEEARRVALNKCSGQCKIVPVKRASAAFAVDGRNPCGAHGFATNARLAQAQNIALRHCYRHGGRDCVIRAWACDGGRS